MGRRKDKSKVCATPVKGKKRKFVDVDINSQCVVDDRDTEVKVLKPVPKQVNGKKSTARSIKFLASQSQESAAADSEESESGKKNFFFNFQQLYKYGLPISTLLSGSNKKRFLCLTCRSFIYIVDRWEYFHIQIIWPLE